MSRTFRRKNAVKLNPWFDMWMENSEWRQSKYGGKYYVRVKCEGKEFKRRLAEFHSDRFARCHIGNTPWVYRNVDHRRHRVKARTALANYRHNSEYVIMLRAQPRWDYWD